MQRFGSLTICNLLACGKLRVSDSEITEKYVGAGYNEITLKTTDYLLKPFYLGGDGGM